MTTTGDPMRASAPVTGMCGAGSITVTPTPHAPVAAKQGVCTAAEMQSLFMNCLNGGTGACTQDACYKCIFSDQAAAAWGPVVVLSTDNLAQMNVGGCLRPHSSRATPPARRPSKKTSNASRRVRHQLPHPRRRSPGTTTARWGSTPVSQAAAGRTYAGTGCQGQITGAGHPGSVCLREHRLRDAVQHHRASLLRQLTLPRCVARRRSCALGLASSARSR